ncbi:MAG TPA: CoA pyrophosphatase [Pirellulales bacterium]
MSRMDAAPSAPARRRTDDLFAEKLRRQLAEPLPGRVAQREFAPENADETHFESSPLARRAAVVVLFFPDDGWRVPLIQRPQHLSHHPGQVGLPGGRLEPGETSWEAARRELWEELGVEAIEPLGALSPIAVTASNHLVEPFVAVVNERPTWTPSVGEVDRILELRASDLLDATVRGHHTRSLDGQNVRTPHWLCDGTRIWGATAMILAELAVVLAKMQGNRPRPR